MTVELDETTRLPLMISWAVRLIAALMLVYMLGVVIAETGFWLNMFTLPSPHQLRWLTYTFVSLALANLLLWPVWSGFANRALQSRVHPDLKSSPLMAALWFVVPGAFLFMPWPVVRELYLASEDPTEWVDHKAPVIGWWWLTRLVLYFGVWPLSAPLDPQGEQFVQAFILQIVIIVELMLEIFLITQMTRWQNRMSMRVVELF